VIERDHAMHLGTREVERLGHHPDGRLRYVAEGRLQCVENRQSGTFTPKTLRDDLRRAFRIPWFKCGHAPKPFFNVELKNED